MKLKIEYIIIAILILLGLFISQCPSPKVEIKSETTVIEKIDTVRIYDTVQKKIPIYIKVPEVIYLKDTLGDSIKLNRYSNNIEDSVIKGEIVSEIDGTLINQTLNYKLKVPQLVIRDSIFTTIEKIILENQNKTFIFAGFTTGGSKTSFNFGPNIGLYSKDYLCSYNYDIINKNHNISFSKRFNLKRK